MLLALPVDQIEDAGYDWKILGPDVSDIDYVAWQSDQDAYACQGQKCSAQSMLFLHTNWEKAGILDKIKENAMTRSLDDLTIGPTLTHTTEDIIKHIESVLEIDGASILFGGKELSKHDIPSIYGAIEPTAVFVPLKEILGHFLRNPVNVLVQNHCKKQQYVQLTEQIKGRFW